MNLSLPQCMTVRSKRATKTKELNSETGGIENGDGPRGAKLMIAGGEKNMMGLSELEDRQTQAGVAVLAQSDKKDSSFSSSLFPPCWCWIFRFYDVA